MLKPYLEIAHVINSHASRQTHLPPNCFPNPTQTRIMEALCFYLTRKEDSG